MVVGSRGHTQVVEVQSLVLLLLLLLLDLPHIAAVVAAAAVPAWLAGTAVVAAGKSGPCTAAAVPPAGGHAQGNAALQVYKKEAAASLARSGHCGCHAHSTGQVANRLMLQSYTLQLKQRRPGKEDQYLSLLVCCQAQSCFDGQGRGQG